MVKTKRSVATAKAGATTTESSVSAPPVNDDGSGNLPDPDVQSKIDLQSLLAQKEKTIEVLTAQNTKLTFDLVNERIKTKKFTKDQGTFRTACRATANQAVTRLKLEMTGLKANMKDQEESKKFLLKAKDIKYKESVTVQKNTLKTSQKLTSTIATMQKTHSLQVTSISTLSGDLMAKIRECDLIKKENKALASQNAALERRAVACDERKMEHALQVKQITFETEALKAKKVDKVNVFKDQSNHQAHNRKLEAIQVTAQCRKKNKDDDVNRRQKAKEKKFQGGSDQMGLLLGEIRKQNEVHGGCVPNPGTTPVTGVSFVLVGNQNDYMDALTTILFLIYTPCSIHR
jgi:hypothetical protein